MWLYRQSTGQLFADNGTLAGTGYAGYGNGKNNGLMQKIPNVGPLPRGFYSIGAPMDNPTGTGPFSLPLSPFSGNLMFGRSGFFMHGDSLVDPGNASDGCIVMPLETRQTVWNSIDHTLEVTL
jgi:hypothetical protein